MFAGRTLKILIFIGLSLLCGIIAGFVYMAGGTTTPYPHLMYFPIMLGAMVGGWFTAMATAVLSSFLMSVWVMPLRVADGTLQTTFGWIFRAAMYISVGAFLKISIDNLQRHQAYLVHKNQQLTAISQSTLQAILHLAETKDPESTGRHLDCLGDYAEVLMVEMGISETQKRHILSGIPLHDIGKVGIPDQILLKPGKLTAEEFEKMKTHATIGSDILKEIEESIDSHEQETKLMLKTAWELTRYHHERHDGLGYPEGLKGEEIPLSARITALCDVYDALAHERPYKPAFPHETCVQIIESERGKQFDPEVVDAFLRTEKAFRQIVIEQEIADKDLSSL